jgi:hypothetical protein
VKHWVRLISPRSCWVSGTEWTGFLRD